MTLEIHKMLVLSTAHLTEDTARKLPRDHIDMASDDDVPSWGPTFAREEGWVFYVGDLSRYGSGPADLQNAVSFAKSQGCVWLMLDADGPTVDLPIYDW